MARELPSGEQSSRRARTLALSCLIALAAFSKSMLVHIVTFSIYFLLTVFALPTTNLNF